MRMSIRFFLFLIIFFPFCQAAELSPVFRVPAFCGDGICTGENCATCPEDCGECPAQRPSGSGGHQYQDCEPDAYSARCLCDGTLMSSEACFNASMLVDDNDQKEIPISGDVVREVTKTGQGKEDITDAGIVDEEIIIYVEGDAQNTSFVLLKDGKEIGTPKLETHDGSYTLDISMLEAGAYELNVVTDSGVQRFAFEKADSRAYEADEEIPASETSLRGRLAYLIPLAALVLVFLVVEGFMLWRRDHMTKSKEPEDIVVQEEKKDPLPQSVSMAEDRPEEISPAEGSPATTPKDPVQGEKQGNL
jgi:hypothetical protein